MFIYALEMRYGVTIRSLSADVDKHTHNLPFFLPLATWSGVQPHCFGIWAYFCLMWWKSELYIIHYMLVPSRCDILYEYCTVGIHILLFGILISQGLHPPTTHVFLEKTTCVEITEGSMCYSVRTSWRNLTCKLRNASTLVMPLMDPVTFLLI